MATPGSYTLFNTGFGVQLDPVTGATSGAIVAVTDGDKIVSFPIPAGAQTNTLAAPDYPGQKITLQATTDGGGTVTITIASTVNAAGNNTLVFGEAQDTIMLQGLASRWMVMSNDGVALSTV